MTPTSTTSRPPLPERAMRVVDDNNILSTRVPRKVHICVSTRALLVAKSDYRFSAILECDSFIIKSRLKVECISIAVYITSRVHFYRTLRSHHVMLEESSFNFSFFWGCGSHLSGFLEGLCVNLATLQLQQTCTTEVCECCSSMLVREVLMRSNAVLANRKYLVDIAMSRWNP